MARCAANKTARKSIWIPVRERRRGHAKRAGSGPIFV
jgi:hypothetical protein